MFRAFGAAAQSDAALAGGSVRAGERNIALFQSKLATTALPPRQLDPVVALLMAGRDEKPRRRLDPAGGAAGRVHPRAGRRSPSPTSCTGRLFGLELDVNAHASAADRPPSLRIGRALGDVFEQAAALERESAQPGRRALASLLEVGHDVVVRRGYQGTRVDDVVAAAGVSHGAFYRYFENKDDLVRVVAVRALQRRGNRPGRVPRRAPTAPRSAGGFAGTTPCTPRRGR